MVSGHGWLKNALLEVMPQSATQASSVDLSELVYDIPALGVTNPKLAYNHTIGALKSQTREGRLTYLILSFSPAFTEHVRRPFELEVSAADIAAAGGGGACTINRPLITMHD